MEQNREPKNRLTKKQRKWKAAKIVFQQMVLEELGIHMCKNESRHKSYTSKKKISQCITNQILKGKTIKHLEGNIGENANDFGSGSSVHGIFQARVLECVAITFSTGPSWPSDRIQHLQADVLPFEPPGKPRQLFR